MTVDKINEILDKHQKWLNKEEGGERADLRGDGLQNANLRGVNLRCALLRGADLRGADLTGGANLEGVDLRGADLRGAYLTDATLVETDLKGADLQGAFLKDADLRGADLDYSCLPLWCGSLTAHFDDRQLKQVAYHLVNAGLYSKNASPETKRELAKLIDFANGFHRVDECGEIKWEEGK